MFRLVKLAAYALFGYVIYEFVIGVTEGRPTVPARRTSAGSVTPMSVSVGDSSGLERTVRVGRGVLR